MRPPSTRITSPPSRWMRWWPFTARRPAPKALTVVPKAMADIGPAMQARMGPVQGKLTRGSRERPEEARTPGQSSADPLHLPRSILVFSYDGCVIPDAGEASDDGKVGRSTALAVASRGASRAPDSEPAGITGWRNALPLFRPTVSAAPGRTSVVARGAVGGAGGLPASFS